MTASPAPWQPPPGSSPAGRPGPVAPRTLSGLPAWLGASSRRMRVAVLSAVLVVAVVVVVLPQSGPGGSAHAAAPDFPVVYKIAAGARAELAQPGAPPPGANDWSCVPSAQHPDPVVLVHGLLANMTENWQTISALLADNGYCVYALTYGTDPGLGFPLDQVGGLQPMEQSAQVLAGFVDRVLASSGAAKVDLVGHSEGATMPYYYLKTVGGAAKVARYVGLAPVFRGTILDGTGTLGQVLAGAFPGLAQVVGRYCGSCPELLAGSGFLAALDADAPAVPGVAFTDIVTRLDEAVTPFTSGLLTGPNVTNIVVQDQCPLDLADHIALAADPVAAQDVLNALDPAHAVAPSCGLVLPLIG